MADFLSFGSFSGLSRFFFFGGPFEVPTGMRFLRSRSAFPPGDTLGTD